MCVYVYVYLECKYDVMLCSQSDWLAAVVSDSGSEPTGATGAEYKYQPDIPQQQQHVGTK